MSTAKEMLDRAIADLEARLGLQPNQSLISGATMPTTTMKKPTNSNKKEKQAHKNKGSTASKPASATTTAASEDDEQQPDICKLEFKVGQIVKVWNHPEADKLYCEEIDIGEETPRQIASGLRPHFSLEQMQGQRLLVVSNLKAKNLVKFKSHGMVLCAAAMTTITVTETSQEGGGEREIVEFIEPPADAKIGEVVTFEGLPPPRPLAPSQVEKKKVFLACMDGMKTTADCVAAWNGHVFMTSAGPCKAKTIAEGVMR